MASSSSSPNGWRVQLVASVPTRSVTLPLYEGDRSAWVTGVCESVVWDDEPYDAWLIGPEPLGGQRVLFSAAGDEPVWTSVRLVESEALLSRVPHDRGERCYRALIPQDVSLFGHVFGFARIEVALDTEGGGTLELATQEVTCLTRHANTEREISGMLRTLLDKPDDEAIRWMVAGSGAGGDLSPLGEQYEEPDYSRSLADLVRGAEEVIYAYDEHMGFFRTHAHSRIQKVERRIPSSGMRLMGDREMRWIMQHADLATEVPVEGGIEYGGSYYMPRYVMTTHKVRSYDNYENRVLVATAQSVERALTTAERRLAEERVEAERLRGRLREFQTGGYSMPALVVVDLVLRRGSELMARLGRARSSMRRVLRQLDSAMPDVTVRDPVRILANPRRTKVFQEVRAYADVFRALLGWKSVEMFSMGRESLGMHALRATKLYEYYCLHELLSTLYDMGYRADDAVPQAFERALYSLDYRKYANERRVATLYHLRAGEERIDLYYQPVIYGSELEENGIDLHRTTSTRPFERAGRTDAPYTPDFLIYHRRGGRVRRIVVDAKFERYSRLHSEGNPTMFVECARKYLLETCTRDGGRVDALWLLSAIGDRDDCLFFEESAWASANDTLVRSGIACVNPMASSMAEMLQGCGIGKDEKRVTLPTGDEPPTAEPDDVIVEDGQERATRQSSAGEHAEVSRVSPSHDSPIDLGGTSRARSDSTRAVSGLSVSLSELVRLKMQGDPARDLYGLGADSSEEAVQPEEVTTTEIIVTGETEEPAPDSEMPESAAESPVQPSAPGIADESAEKNEESALKRSSLENGKHSTHDEPKEETCQPTEMPGRRKKPKKPKKAKASCKRPGGSGELHGKCVRLIGEAMESNDFFARTVGQELEKDGGAVKLREGFHLLRTRPPTRGQMRQYAKADIAGRELYVYRLRNPVQLAQVRAVLKATYGIELAEGNGSV